MLFNKISIWVVSVVVLFTCLIPQVYAEDSSSKELNKSIDNVIEAINYALQIDKVKSSISVESDVSRWSVEVRRREENSNQWWEVKIKSKRYIPAYNCEVSFYSSGDILPEESGLDCGVSK